LRATVWILGVIMALNNAGQDVGALLAGVGIGGLALAMAAKDFVANIFGGITIFVDKPFVVGDRILISGTDGTVKEIGIRSTRIQTLQGRQVTVPNHKFTDSFVENVSAEAARKMRLDLGLVYTTKPEEIEQALEILRRLIAAQPDTTDATTIWFSGFGDFSLNVSAIYYVASGGDITGTSSALNLSVLSEFNSSGLEFAFPTQQILLENNTPS
jgi:MscS family membrane protein